MSRRQSTDVEVRSVVCRDGYFLMEETTTQMTPITHLGVGISATEDETF